MYEWMGEWKNEWKNKGMRRMEWISSLACIKCECMNEWVNVKMNERIKEWEEWNGISSLACI